LGPDPLGNESLYTPYKATGNIVFKENDFTGAIYAPDHNFVFQNTKDGKGKRHKRKQTGNDFYGSYVGRTINNKSQHNFHFDESLNDAGPLKDSQGTTRHKTKQNLEVELLGTLGYDVTLATREVDSISTMLNQF